MSAELKGCLKRLVESGKMMEETDLTKLRDLCIKEIFESKCLASDKSRMIMNLNNLHSVEAIQKFIFNAFLKYNGMGIIQKRQDY